MNELVAEISELTDELCPKYATEDHILDWYEFCNSVTEDDASKLRSLCQLVAKAYDPKSKVSITEPLRPRIRNLLRGVHQLSSKHDFAEPLGEWPWKIMIDWDEIPLSLAFLIADAVRHINSSYTEVQEWDLLPNDEVVYLRDLRMKMIEQIEELQRLENFQELGNTLSDEQSRELKAWLSFTNTSTLNYPARNIVMNFMDFLVCMPIRLLIPGQERPGLMK
jgi:hypothetical protein